MAKEITFGEVAKGLPSLPKYVAKYNNYRVRLSQFVFWWNDRLVSSVYGGIVNSVISYKHKRCLCVAIRISHKTFTIEIDLRPCNSGDDIGTGSGKTRVIIF